MSHRQHVISSLCACVTTSQCVTCGELKKHSIYNGLWDPWSELYDKKNPKSEPKKWVKPPSAAITRSAIALPAKKYSNSKTKKEIKTRRHCFLEKLSDCNAPINVKPAGRRVGWQKQGIGWGFDIFQDLPSNSLPKGKSSQSIATKFPHPRLHIAVKYPKGGPKKGTIKIFPNKILQSLFIKVVASPKIDVPVTAAIKHFKHYFNPCYTV